MYLLIAFFLIEFKAIPDALYDRGYKTWSKRIRFWYDVVFYLIIFMWFTNQDNPNSYDPDYWYVIIGAVLLRFALFDISYNLMKQNPIFYIGSTDDLDVFLGWFFKKTRIPSEHFLFMCKLIALIVGITFLLGLQNGFGNG